ncbi:MAG TPA: chromosome segregation protein SMC, partial [Candidatus Methanoperedens sp.]|nr:chromosome segregation protein SMC [Candidatus Methanoperedens sp.]
MIFKKLELQGFKTFFDRTEVHFRPGINAVVGPNGCGKSNIADAIRWVLGEQSPKQLRGERMEDLIFSGSEGRHPLGMAEVSLTVELTGEELPAPYNAFTEVCVTRRLYRSGESEYFINNSICRLRDIRELFLDTGLNPKAYAVISQGHIGSIVDAHPEDRRVLFEEAAGIAKFKERKVSALRKLDATEQNLVRLADLTAEVKRQLGSLQRQARKAERYHELRRQFEELELRVQLHHHGTISARVAQQGEQIRGLFELQETLRAETAGLEASHAAAGLETLELEKSLGSLREEFYARRAALESLDQRLDESRARLAARQRSIAQGDDEAARLAGLIAEHAADLARIDAEVTSLAAALVGTEARARETEAALAAAAAAAAAVQGALAEASGRLREEASVESEAQRALARVEMRAEAVAAELARVGGELEAIEHEDAALAVRETELAAALGARREEHERLAGEGAAAGEALAEARLEASAVDVDLAGAREEANAAGSRLSSLSELERNLSGWPERFQEELARVLSHADLDGGLRGLLADALQVPPEHEVALEAVLGDRLKCLLVNAPAVGIEAARVLQEGTAVRGTFLPVVPRSRAAVTTPHGAGVLARMLDVVSVPRELRAVAEHLLQDVVIVESLAAARTIWDRGDTACTLVTPAGEVLWPDGSVTAGRLDPSRELLPLVRSIRETQAAAAAAAERATAHAARQEQVRARLRALEETARVLAERVREVEQAMLSLEQDLLLTRQKRGAHAAQRERLADLAGKARAEQSQLEGSLQTERSRHDRLAAVRARREEELARLDAALAARLREERSLLERLGADRIELAAGRERSAHLATRREHLAGESGRAAQRRAQIAREIEADRAASLQAASGVEELARERVGLAADRDRLEGLLGAAQARHRDLAGAAREDEERLRQLRLRREELQGEHAALQVRRAEEEVRREHLRARIVELRAQAPEELLAADALAALLAEPLAPLEESHRELGRQIEALGPVNLAAIGDQQELQERLAAQRRQQEDLEQASQDLRRAIGKINATSREKFLETFEKINEKFQETFPQLLENGHALLRLVEGEDPLEAGVEILAQPAG